MRLTTDPDTSQVIVLAPPEVQALIARELARPAAVAAAGAAGLPASLPARPAAGSLQLTRVPLARIEAQLRQMLGSRLEPRPPGRTGGPDFVLVKGTRRLEITLERPNNTVHLFGDPPLVTQVSRLLSALDVTEPVPGVTRQAVRIIPLQRADPAKVQQSGGRAASGSGRRPCGSGESRGGRHEPVPAATALAGPPGPAFAEPAEAGKPPVADEPDVQPHSHDGRRSRRAGTAGRRLRQLGDNVEIETLPDLDVIILRGRDPDVDEVARIIAELERLSAETIPGNRNLPAAACALPVPRPDPRPRRPGFHRRPPGQDPHDAVGQAERLAADRLGRSGCGHEGVDRQAGHARLAPIADPRLSPPPCAGRVRSANDPTDVSHAAGPGAARRGRPSTAAPIR